MAGQSIVFDFLTTGAEKTASGFRKVGDNTFLAAKGAKVLADAIEKLGSKEGRTAAESATLARALRQTGDAEDRVAARAVVADAAIRRLGDAMQDSTKSSGQLRKALDGLKLNPGLAGPALLLAPALTTVAGVAAGAGIALGGAFAAGGIALASFGAVAKPVLTQAKTAAEAVNKAQNTYNAAIAAGVPKAQAQATLQKANASAQLTYNAALAGGAKPATALAAYHLALAKNQLAYNTATNAGTYNAKAYAAEQKAIGKAYAEMSPQQIALSKQLGAMASAWQDLKAAQTPVVAGALQPWLRSVTDLTKNLAPIIAKVSPVIGYLGTKFDALVKSSAFRGFRDFIASTGAASVSATGGTLIDFFKGFIILLPKFDPLIREAVGWISRLGPAFVTWASSQKTADHIQGFMQWFSRNGPVVGGLLKNIGGALKALAPGLASGGAEELKIISGFFGFVAKLPPAIAKPLAEVAGTLLILNKMGVLKVGVQIVGAAAKWLTGGLISITGGDAAAAAMRAAFASGGAAAAAEIRAAMAGGGATAGAEGAAGGTAAKGGLGGLAALVAPLAIGIAGTYIAGHIAAHFLPAPTQRQTQAFQQQTPGPLQGYEKFFLGIKAATAPGWLKVLLLGAPAVIPMWSTMYEHFQRDFAGKITSWFTVSLPHAFLGYVPGLWSDAYTHFQRDFAGKITSWFTVSLPHAASLIGGAFSGAWGTAWNGFNRDVVQKITGFFTTTLPGFFSSIGSKVSSAGGSLVSMGTRLITGLWNGISGFWTGTVWPFFTGLGAKIGGSFDTSRHQAAVFGAFMASSFDTSRHQVAHTWGVLMSDITTSFDIAKETIRIAWDQIELKALSTADSIMTIMGKLPGPLGAPFRAAHRSIAGEMAGIQGDVATAMQNVQADIDKLHGKTVGVQFVGSGTGQIAFKESIPGVTLGPSSSGLLGFHAAGGRITGGTPGRDSVLGMLTPGEVVVPVPLVQAGAVDHLRGRLPGFASGGTVTGMGAADRIPAAGVPFMANAEAAFGRRAEQAFATAAIAAAKAALNAYSSPLGSKYMTGSGVMRWDPLVKQALSMEGLGAYLASQVEYQMMTESGGRPDAINRTDSNAAAGDPSRGLMQTIMATFLAYHWPGTSMNIYDPLANIAAAINYARHRYGPTLMSGGMGMGSGHGYASGTSGAAPGWGWVGERGPELVKFSGGEQVLSTEKLGGYADGTAGAGAAWLKAWQTRHGGGYGAAWAPVVVNEQIAQMAAAIGRAQTLSKAGGLTAGQHKFWSSAAADETRRLGVLNRELTTERAWRYQLQLNELGLDKEIRAAGDLPSLAGNVRAWKAQMATQKATVDGISGMLGYSNAYLAAHPPAPVLPGVTHVYGGDVTGTIGAVLASALGPFTGTSPVTMDKGGWLRPGFNSVWNGTGRPEPVGAARGSSVIHLEVSGGQSEFDQFMLAWIRRHAKIKGGGNVQVAFGAR